MWAVQLTSHNAINATPNVVYVQFMIANQVDEAWPK